MFVTPNVWMVVKAAKLAWTAVERAIRQAGSYRGVTFSDASIGDAVLQVFGSWPAACAYDFDSPGWAIKRQTFLAVFPTLAIRAGSDPVTLSGQHRNATPMLVGHVAGLPAPRMEPREALPPMTQTDATRMIADLRDHGVVVPFTGGSR